MTPPQEGENIHDLTEGRLDLALRASNEGIWDWWTDKNEIYYSRRILEFLECGDKRAPNFFTPPHKTVHKDDRDRFMAALANALDPGGPELFSIDCRVHTGSDGWRWLRIRGTVVRNRLGQATRIAGSMIDISRRKSAEAQIDEERHQLRLLIDHVPLQVYFKDTKSRFVLANKRMAEWNNVANVDEITGKHDRDFFASEHWEAAARDEQEIMATGNSITGKLEHEVREGRSSTWVLTSKFPWFDRKGKIKGTFGVSSDVTELVEAQHKAANLASELAERNQVYEEEVQLAREIQQALARSHFPSIFTSDQQLQFGARYQPTSGLAGDFFEIVRISDEVCGLLICDVMGHGVRSALVVAMLRGLMEKQRRSASDPSAYLSGLNNGLSSILERAEATMFATAFYAVVDLNEGTIHYACAGHPGAIVSGSKGVYQIAARKDERGPGLGLIPKAGFPAQEIPLDQVKRLLLFTDGLIEAENEAGDEFLESGLIKAIEDRTGEPLEEMLDGVITTVLAHAEGHHFGDDVCLLGMEVGKA
ncbi:SpoIIE family protein phosphatase [Haloferula chungangensis]|uniref:SpoIIE family protein phosphatase n=1 Tax=Haloferula chungangensis TaxID=1048331 RepID=A0ABW2L9D7_9BACT